MIDKKYIATAIAVKIQRAVLCAVHDGSEADMRNLSAVILDAIEPLVHVYSSRHEMDRQSARMQIPYEEMFNRFKYDSTRQFADEVIEKDLVHRWKWNPNPGQDMFRIDEISFGAIDMNKISEMLKG